MRYLLIIMAIFLALYLGSLIGIYVLCEALSAPRSVREKIWFIPVILLLYPFHILAREENLGFSKFRELYYYLALPCKTTLVLGVLIECERASRSEARRANTHRSIQVPFLSQVGYSVAAISNRLSAAYSYSR